jgi:hypothetical protein
MMTQDRCLWKFFYRALLQWLPCAQSRAVGMEKCDDEAVVNEAGQAATPAKHANVRVIPSDERTKKNSMEFELYAICKDVYG